MNITMQWYDKLFFASLSLVGIGGVGVIVAWWGMLSATRRHL